MASPGPAFPIVQRRQARDHCRSCRRPTLHPRHGGFMYIAGGRTIAKFGGLTSVSALTVLLVSGAGLPPSNELAEVGVVEMSAVDSAAPDTISALQLPRTASDSLRAESALPTSAVRRPLELYLGRYSDDRLLVRRISRAVLRES